MKASEELKNLAGGMHADGAVYTAASCICRVIEELTEVVKEAILQDEAEQPEPPPLLCQARRHGVCQTFATRTDRLRGAEYPSCQACYDDRRE